MISILTDRADDDQLLYHEEKADIQSHFKQTILNNLREIEQLLHLREIWKTLVVSSLIDVMRDYILPMTILMVAELSLWLLQEFTHSYEQHCMSSLAEIKLSILV